MVPFRTEVFAEPDGRFSIWFLDDAAGTRKFGGMYQRRADAARTARGVWLDAKEAIERYERVGVRYVSGIPFLAGWD